MGKQEGDELEEARRLLEAAWAAMDVSPRLHHEPPRVAEFMDRMLGGVAYWEQQGDQARAHECGMAVEWARQRLRWLEHRW
jgi:hypothetical protein